KTLRRAMQLAEARGSEQVGRCDLIEALLEAEATQAGLNLDRLRYARRYTERVYGEVRPALRQEQASAAARPDEPPA
ncbi:MAG: hypothetical protein AB7K36_27345, partial [Chloroflexota bacterium]